MRKVARQFYNYGTGRGHTQIEAQDFAYNLRNLGLILFALAICLVTPLGLAFAAALGLYFYVWAFHSKAARIVRRTRRWSAYPLTMLVMWVVMASNLAGYVVGSWQRIRHRGRYRSVMDSYMSAT